MDKRMDAYSINNRLYWTNGNIANLYYECVDPDTGEMTEDFQHRLEQLLRFQEENKDDAVNDIKSRAAMIAARKAEIKRLQDANDKDAEYIEMLKTALSDVLEGEKYQSAVGTVSYRHSKGLRIDDADALIAWAQEHDDSLLTYAKPSISKTAVTDAIKNGTDVPFCEIEERVSVTVK